MHGILDLEGKEVLVEVMISLDHREHYDPEEDCLYPDMLVILNIEDAETGDRCEVTKGQEEDLKEQFCDVFEAGEL